MWEFWSQLDFSWVGDLAGGVWTGVANMITSFSPLLALFIGLSFGFLVIGAIVNVIFRRKEDDSWW